MWLDCLTWKTLGALTSEASAEDRVAEKIPAEIRGAKPDTRLITCVTHTHTHKHVSLRIFVSLLAQPFAKAVQQLNQLNNISSRVQKCQGCQAVLPGAQHDASESPNIIWYLPASQDICQHGKGSETYRCWIYAHLCV